jgi:hypothetical protein
MAGFLDTKALWIFNSLNNVALIKNKCGDQKKHKDIQKLINNKKVCKFDRKGKTLIKC